LQRLPEPLMTMDRADHVDRFAAGTHRREWERKNACDVNASDYPHALRYL
jgi:hypothetical protein